MQFNDHQVRHLSELYPFISIPLMLDIVEALGFSAENYLKFNPDLVNANLDETAAAYHYLSCGALTEQRRFGCSADTGGRPWIAALRAFPIANGYSRKLIVNLLFNRILNGKSVFDDEEECLAEFLEVCRDKAIFTMLVIGDSHSHVYAIPHEIEDVVCVPIHMLCSGGSASGLANSDSKSKYGQKIVHFFDANAELIKQFRLPCFFKFGQVDAEFVWIFKRVRQGMVNWSFDEFESFASESSAHYMDFLQHLSDAHHLADHMRVLSIFPPVLSDAAWHAGYVNAHIGFLESDTALDVLSEKVRHLVIPTQRERTRLHMLWNALMMSGCARRGLLYVDDFNELMGNQGIVDGAYMVGHDGSDHHLSVNLLGEVVRTIFARYAVVEKIANHDI